MCVSQHVLLRHILLTSQVIRVITGMRLFWNPAAQLTSFSISILVLPSAVSKQHLKQNLAFQGFQQARKMKNVLAFLYRYGFHKITFVEEKSAIDAFHISLIE